MKSVVFRWALILTLIVGVWGLIVMTQISKMGARDPATDPSAVPLNTSPTRSGISRMVQAGETPASFDELRDQFVDADRHRASSELLQRFAPGRTPEETAKRYLSSLQEEIDYPFLPLLTKGSQVMRLEYPYPPRNYRARWQSVQDAGEMTIQIAGKFAVAKFKRSKRTAMFLQRDEDGLWFLDLQKTSAGFTFLFGEHPWDFAFPNRPYRENLFPLPLPFELEDDPIARIASLQKEIAADPQNADRYFELASHLYFSCHLIRAAINSVEKGLTLAPDAFRYRFLAIRLRTNAPTQFGVREHYEEILKIKPRHKRAWDDYHRWAKHTLKDEVLASEIARRRAVALP